MLMHRITVGASSAWNSLFSCRPEDSQYPTTTTTTTTTEQLSEALLPSTGIYLDEGVDFRFPSFRKSFDLNLADGAHVQVVHCRTASKAGGRGGQNRQNVSDSFYQIHLSSLNKLWSLNKL